MLLIWFILNLFHPDQLEMCHGCHWGSYSCLWSEKINSGWGETKLICCKDFCANENLFSTLFLFYFWYFSYNKKPTLLLWKGDPLFLLCIDFNVPSFQIYFKSPFILRFVLYSALLRFFLLSAILSTILHWRFFFCFFVFVLFYCFWGGEGDKWATGLCSLW